MELIACEHGKSKTFMLPFVEYGATDFKAGVTLEAGDVQISKGGAAFVNIATLPTILGKWMVITLSAAEMQYGFVSIQVIDQTATKVFEDTGAILTTTVQGWYQALFSLIESQRGSHTGVKEMIFWDPVGGLDTNSGLIFSEPKLTYNFNGANGVHDLLNANEHQIIIGLPHATGAPTTVSEYVEVDSAYTFLRCPGRDFLIEANHNEACALKASAEGVELSGLRVKTKATGSQDAICSSGDFVAMRNLWVDLSQGHGISIDNASSCILDDFLVQDAAKGGSGHAVNILGDVSLTTRNIIGSGRIFANGDGGETDGIRVDGEFCDHNFIIGGPKSLLIHENTGYGIQEVNDANHTIVVGPTINLAHNILGDHNLTGTGSLIVNHEQWGKQEDLLNIPTTNVSVLAFPGTFSPTFATQGNTIPYPIKTLSRFAYDFKADISGAASIYFALKENLEDTEYVIDPKNVIADIDDAVAGTGFVPLTVLESTVTPKTYYGEVQTRDGAGNATASWQFKLKMTDKVMN